jgi:hypothetical protein
MNVFGNPTLSQAVSTALFQNDQTGASIKIDVQIVDCIEETGLYEEPSQVDMVAGKDFLKERSKDFHLSNRCTRGKKVARHDPIPITSGQNNRFSTCISAL